MTEKNLRLTDQTGTPTDLKLSTPDAQKIIVQPVQSYQDRIAEKVTDQLISQSAGAGLAVVVTVAGMVVAAKWLDLPKMIQTFLENQRRTSEAIASLADGLKALVREHEENSQNIKELKSDVRDIKEDVVELKHTISKCPNIS